MKIVSINLNCFKIELMKHFYTLLGAEFQEYQVTLGGKGYKANLQGIEIGLAPVSEIVFSQILTENTKFRLPAYQMTFHVNQLINVIEGVRRDFPAALLSDVISDTSGSFVLLEDPQGNKVQLVQK